MESLVLVKENPRCLAILPVTQRHDQYCLMLETVSQQGAIGYSARLAPANSLDFRQWTQLPQTTYGCLGLLHFENDDYVIFITDFTLIGNLDSKCIFRIAAVSFISLSHNRYDSKYDVVWSNESLNSSSTFIHPCQDYIKFLSSGSFYFSYDYDITRSAQKRFHDGDFGSIVQRNFWSSFDDRFFWNSFLIQKLLSLRSQLSETAQGILDHSGLLVLIVQGFVSIEDVMNSDEGSCVLAVISRMSCKRTGTRYNARGVDDDGNVANFVETETILITPKFFWSYIIVRGSVPVFWEQQGLQVGQHKLQISRGFDATTPAFDRHFCHLIEQYGKVHVIDLLSQKDNSVEAALSSTYAKQIQALGANKFVTRTAFDFHAITKGYNFDRVDILIRYVNNEVLDLGCFLYERRTNSVQKFQKGIFRVNCLDCLDRTNVIQSSISLHCLMDFCSNNERHLVQAIREQIKNIWANNGDSISLIYAGTGALKSGFTRTGKRTLAGMMDDMKKTAQRFYINNFQDQGRQIVIDQLLGKIPSQTEVLVFNPVAEAVMQEMERRKVEYCSYHNIIVYCVTYNVNGRIPDRQDDFCPLFIMPGGEIPDLIVISFQEIVELTPTQIMSTDSEPRKLWETLIGRSLKKMFPHTDFSILTSGQLVGTSISVFVKTDLLKTIRKVEVAAKKTGLGGMAGNKGGIAVRLEIEDSSVCIVGCHFAAGQTNVEDRNRDFFTVFEGMVFTKGRKILGHDAVIFLGDFNYRVNLPSEAARAYAQSKSITKLIQFDQFIIERSAKRAFSIFTESPIGFLPTYKFDVGTDSYDTSEKNRVPSWTDRILCHGQVTQYHYNSILALKLSDHKPVVSLLNITIKAINKDKKSALEDLLQKKYSPLQATNVQPPVLPPRPKLSTQTIQRSPQKLMVRHQSEVTVGSAPPITDHVYSQLTFDRRMAARMSQAAKISDQMTSSNAVEDDASLLLLSEDLNRIKVGNSVKQVNNQKPRTILDFFDPLRSQK